MNARFAAVRALAACTATIASLTATDVQAIALYNRQTGQPCGACHTAPPELTPFGRRFMLGGFAMSGGKTGIPASVYVEAGFTSTAKDNPTPRPGVKDNHNAGFQKAKAMIGGAITETTGAFADVVYDAIDEQLRPGNVDIRHSDSLTLGRHDVLYGITVHNQPGFQDPWNSTFARTWPYAPTATAPTPRTTPLLEGPLAQRVLGAGAYVFVDDATYAELAAYRKIGRGTQDALGLEPAGTRTVEGTAYYVRVAHEAKLRGATLTIGASAFDADLSHPGGIGSGTDEVSALGADLLYQWGGGPHEATVRATANRERWSLDSSVAQGLAEGARNRLENFKVSASYLYAKKYSATVGVFRRAGTSDALFFGTANGRPDTAGVQLDAFVINPFFPPPAWHPGMRTRIGLTYTHFTRFDGARRNYDGSGRNASANENFLLYLLWAF